jgi:uncharacterized protein (DUF2267 family)
MTQHKNPLERDPNQPGTEPDSGDFSASVGDDAGVFTNTDSHARRGSDDRADSGMDPTRAAALQQAEADPELDPPPADFRPDSMVRATSPQARVEMERNSNSDFGNQPSFTKGHNAPTADQSRTDYTVEEMDEILTEARPGVFPDTPGGAGAAPLAHDRHEFIREVTNLGHFPSRGEAEKWTRAVFNALRHRAIEVDDALATEFASVVRVGESPEVQVEEMMWSGDYVDRLSRLVCVLQDWTRQAFYEQVAEQARETTDDPWVDAAVYSFFGALKQSLDGTHVCNLGELQDVWDRA